MIRTLEGRVGSGKTSRVLDEIAAASEKGERVIWLVPEQMTLQAELMLAEKLNTPGFLLTEVLSPTRLTSRVFEAAGGLAGLTLIDEQGRAFALRACLADIKLSYYNGCAAKAGFVEWLLNLTDELSRSVITPTDLRLCADGAEEDSPLQRKLYDIAAIVDGYRDAIEGRFLDGGDTTELFAKRVQRAEFVRDAYVWVDGFDIMPPRGLKLIAALAAAAREVTVALTLPAQGSESDGLFDAVWTSRERLCAYAEEAGVSVTRETLRKQEYHSAEIGFLEEQWDRFPADPYPHKPRDLSLRAAKKPSDEAAVCAAEILRLVREEGYRFGEIAVAAGGLEGYAPHLTQSFAEREIPYFIARDLPAGSHPAARYWLCAMEAATTGMRPEQVLRALKSGYSGVSEDESDLLSNYQFTKGLKGHGWEREIADDPLWEAARLRFITPLLAFQKRIQRAKTASDYAYAAYVLLEEAGVYERLMEEKASFEENGNAEAAQHNAQVWERITATLDQAVELIGKRELPFSQMLLALRGAMEAGTLAALPPRPDVVLVAGLSGVKTSGLKALFVLGLNDGLIPAPPSAAELLSNNERLSVNQTANRFGMKTRLNADIERDQAERFSIYAALTLPTHKLYLSSSLADETGGARRPSLLREKLASIFPLLVEEEAGPPQADTLRAALWRAASRAVWQKDQNAAQIFRYLSQKPDLQADANRIRRVLDDDARRETLSPQTAQLLYGRDIRMGITRIERYANCPYQHFVQYALRPEELFPPGVRPPDAGLVYHTALEGFVQSNPDYRNLTESQCDEIAARAIEPALLEILMKQDESPRLNARLAELSRIAKRSARVLARQLRASRFLPVGQEIGFGKDKPYPALELILENGATVRLEGRIDRVDLCEIDGKRYLRVIDYKSGAARLDRDAVDDGRLLQLPIYASVAEAALNAETAGLFYFKVARGIIAEPPGDLSSAIAHKNRLEGLLLMDLDVLSAMDGEMTADSDVLPVRLKKNGDFDARSRVIPAPDLRRLLADALQTAAQIADRMLSGEIAPHPYHDKGRAACDYCAYHSICRYEG